VTYVGIAMNQLTKAIAILRKPKEARRMHFVKYLHFAIGLPFFGVLKPWLVNVFWSYLPDSFSKFGDHSEFHDLFKKFTRNNSLNNGGDLVRLWTLMLNCKAVLESGVSGDVAELGVWRGNTSAVMAHYAQKHQRKMYLFDTFEGFSNADLDGIDDNKDPSFSDTSVEMVTRTVGIPQHSLAVVKGRFPDSLASEHDNLRFSLVSLDCDLYLPMRAGLEYFYPRLDRGGIIFVHDYSSYYWDGAKKAVDEFLREVREFPVMVGDKSGTVVIRKTQ
jgi:Macrocin-O-methyltransferase (TylF)